MKYFLLLSVLFFGCASASPIVDTTKPETDPVFKSYPAFGIKSTDITNWNFSYNKSKISYTSAQVDSAIKANQSAGTFKEVDPVFTVQIINYYNKSQSDARYAFFNHTQNIST